MDVWKNTLMYMFQPNQIDGQSPQMLLSHMLCIGRYSAVDRTKSIQEQKDLVVCTPIPIAVCPVELVDAIVSAASGIALRNKPIYLLWSGGIDSTTALYALLDTGISFTVVMDEKTVQEYPLLADELLKGKNAQVTTMLSTSASRVNLNAFVLDNPDVLFITGELGDQIFGSDMLLTRTYEQRNLPIQQAVALGLVHQSVYDYCKNSVDALPGVCADTMLLSEFLWALNFVFKYQTVQLRTAMFGLRSQGENKNCIHFFDTELFNTYALNNYKNNTGFVELTEYKMPLKDYIFVHNGDAIYRDTKLKEPSLQASSYFGRARV